MEVSKLIDEVRGLNLPPRATIADVGCGDGRTALAIAREFEEIEIVGIDFSEGMIATATELIGEAARAEPGLAERVRFREGDVNDLDAAVGPTTYHLVITDRCLINLTSWESQRGALANIAEHLVPGGHYLAVENFIDGHEAMNRLRRTVGLPDIPVRWHNLLLEEDRFLQEAARWFDALEVEDFTSTYYLITRVVYSSLCAREGIDPDYHHPIHEIAAKLPSTGRFSPIRFLRMRRRA
jgi:SAM-dependent methyltransferase